MSDRDDRENTAAEGPRQRNVHQDAKVWKPKRGANKRGVDRRFSMKSKQYEDNMHIKLDGGEVPKTLKVSSLHLTNFSLFYFYRIQSHNKKEEKMPVGPIYIGLFLFLVVGSALI